jgi:hypothetical protein
MVKFVETVDFDYVSLAHVATVTITAAGKQALCDATGRVLGVAREEVTDDRGTLVAAAAGMFATTIYANNDPPW